MPRIDTAELTNLTGRAALVTGGGDGLGHAIGHSAPTTSS